ncbi:Uroporphyrinogen decarboxylase [Sporomusa silvacetica DSM 10669]|uniref:Uroporphyrinogen decarboxylase n=1 Tax=Sporomusa silvacetica DSM 10669 TaxID=1123289 RepID=A0ABZ3II03_9FIRM|nr:uroporphyrinogen decarboxylase family protein [Sporomusa silvacetica]OZC14850.1 uroporphyrinogen decarboxylase [Sporomusa silvacetica DSM 10669]
MSTTKFKNEMTPKERIAALQEGKPYDRVPCNPSLSAHAARVTGITVAEYHLSAEKMAEAQIAAYKTYGHDFVGVSAILGIVHAMGGHVEYPQQSSPYIAGQLVKKYSDLHHLQPLNAEKNEHLLLIFRAAEILLDELGNEVPVSIGVRAPFSTAATLRGVELFMRDLYSQPELVHRLLQFALDNTIAVIKKALNLGVAVSISDPVASGSLISATHYREYAFPYAKKLIDAIKAAGGSSPTLHICGNTKKIWQAMADTGAGALSIEDKIDLSEVKRAVGDRVIIAGNIRPSEAMYQGKPEDVVADVKQGLRQAFDNPKGYIVQLGCGLPIDTPPENIHALVGAVRKYGQYPLNPELF